VLQGRHVLDLMIANIGKANSLFVSQKLIFFRVNPIDDSVPLAAFDNADLSNESLDSPNPQPGDGIDENYGMQETLELEESLRFVFSQAFRSDAKSPDSERIHVFNRKKSLTIIDGYIVPYAENRFNFFKDLLLYRSRDELAQRLLELGVDVFVSSLGRFEDRIAFVIGANYPDESVSQIWIDQETFLPIRWIIKDPLETEDSDVFEIRYVLWWKVGKTRYPSRVEFYQDGNLVRMSEAKNFEEDATFSKTLFDIEKLKLAYPLASPQPVSSSADEEPSEVQRTIEEFKRIFE
jgi:hypothetical protein